MKWSRRPYVLHPWFIGRSRSRRLSNIRPAAPCWKKIFSKKNVLKNISSFSKKKVKKKVFSFDPSRQSLGESESGP